MRNPLRKTQSADGPEGGRGARARRRVRPALLGAVGLVALAVAAGSRSRGPSYDRIPGMPATRLSGTVLSADERLGAPSAIAVAGARLLVADAFGDAALHVLRRSDGAVERSLGRRGEGPGEFRVIASFAPSPDDPDAVWAYDFALHRLTRITPGEPFPESAREEGRILRLAADVPLLHPEWSGDSLIVSVGFFDAGRLGRFAPDGRALGAVGPLPPGDPEVAPRVRQHAYQSVLRARPDGMRLAVGARYAGRIELYAPDGSLLRLAAVPFPFEPTYEVGVGEKGPYFVSGPHTRYGYVDLAVTRTRIYALFSGRRRGEADDANLGRQVHVFDWGGMLRHALELDAALSAIAVDPEGEVLYGARLEPIPAILVYPLPAPADAAET